MKLAAATPAVLLTWTLTAFSPALTHAGQAAAPAAPAAAQSLPTGVERITSVEGITEYRLANGLQVLLFPDQSKQTITVNVTVQGRLAPRGLRRDRHGPPARAPGVQGIAEAPATFRRSSPSTARVRTAPPGSTARTTSRRSPRPTTISSWALDLEVGPHGQLLHRQGGSRQRDDRRPQRVRVRARTVPTSVLLERVMSTAYLWHNYGKSTIGSRSDIENVPIDRLQAFYRKLLSARQRRPARRRQIRRAEDARADRASTSASIPKPTRTFRPLHRRADAGWRASGHLRRVGDVQWVLAAYHVPAGGDPDFAALDLVVQVLGDTPSGRLHKALVETKQASQTFGGNFQLHDPGIAYFAAQVARSRRSTLRATRC